MSPDTQNFKSAGNTVKVDLFTPTVTPNGGVILIVHGSDGIVDNDHGHWLTVMTGYARDLAGKGFVTLMPHYFEAGKPVDFTKVPIYHAVLADAVASAKTLPSVDSGRVGLLGFSLGGHLCLRCRSLTNVLVEFFAPELPELGGIGTAANMKLHVQIHHGERDELVPIDKNREPITRTLLKEGAGVTLYTYKDAGHGFSGKFSGDIWAQTASKEHTVEFFEKFL